MSHNGLSEDLGLKWESEPHLGHPTGPFTSNVGHQAALEQIAHVRAMLNAMREEENLLRANLGIFKIEQPASKDLQNLEKVVCLARPSWWPRSGGRGEEKGSHGPQKTPGTRKMGAREAFLKNRGKTRVAKEPFYNEQLSGIQYIHDVVQPSLIILLYFHHPPENLVPFSSDSHFPQIYFLQPTPTPAPDNH